MSKITYADKEILYINADVPAINKCQTSDMNEIKQVVNENDNKVGELNEKLIQFEEMTKQLGKNFVTNINK